MSFLKPPVFVKTILLSCALFASMFFNSCKQLTSFDPNVDGVRVAVSDAFSAPADVKATHGLKQKISLEWLPVSGARYYDIYSAESATAEFKKIGETDKNSFDDRVGAGRTLYYRVCAVKSDGTQSASSATVKGTSLAAPVISGGDVSDCSATISWFMENARAVDGTDNYEGSLIFVVHWQQKNGGTPNEKTLAAAKDFTNSFYEWTIDNLSGASDYEFWIEAYLSGDQTNNENSPKVDKKTLTSYTPLAPDFRATQGESAKGVWLYITLPEKVMVQTETKESPNEKSDELYPLKFEISRAIGEIGEDDSGASWETVCKYLYYNGNTTPPAETEYAESPYNAGDEIKWFDESTNLVGGEKYTYRIRSFVDTGYSKVVCPEGKEYNGNASTPENKASKALGWKSAHPSFKVNYSPEGSRKLSDDKTKVLSVSFGFEAEWKDLGKAGEYKFAIKQNRKPYKENYSGSGDDTWLKNADGGDFFGTIEEIASYAVKFGSAESGLSEEKKEIGVYSYTLYIVLKDAVIDEAESKMLDSVKAADEIVVTDVVKLPKAELRVNGGYKDKVVLNIAYEPGVTYKVMRTRLDTNPQEVTPEFKIDVLENPGASFEYPDPVEGNGRYSYILKAVESGSKAFSLSPAQEAETLGTPKVSFEKERLCYDSVTISFDGVLAAKKYTVTLGEAGGFGGGETFEITKGGDEWNSASVSISPSGNATATAKVALAANKFTVTIEKPYGYDDARLAGKTADAIVTAHSDVDKAPSATEQVNVVGPACLEAKVNSYENATENSITLTWKAVEGANGYLIKRVMYKDIKMESVANGSGVTYYYEVASKKITADGDGEAIGDRAKVEPSGDQFTLTDTYMEITTSDETLKEYQEKQAKIAWGLPFRYVVLPVFKETDFGFESNSLKLSGGKVAYTNFEEKKTDGAATFGYGLKVHAKKSESVTTQNVTWEKPFYGDENLTPKVYRRKFSDNDKNEWLPVDSTPKNCEINYSLSGEDRYCAWEYVVKYLKNPDSDKIAPSYLEWLKDSDHDETNYDYGKETKEKLNKGYLLAMNYSAKYGGDENTSKTDSDYYSEDVEIKPWIYTDRTLGPDKVELKVLSLDLAGGWQSVGILDPEITKFIDKKTLTDTDVSDVSLRKIKLKPTQISKNLNGKGTTDGPLKILRSAKHYYGLNLSRGGNDGFDCKNYEEYAYRQITDEELIKSTMLVVAEVITNSGILKQAYGTNGYQQAFPGFGWNHNSGSIFWWVFDKYAQNWNQFPYQNFSDINISIPHFIFITDKADCNSNSDNRGKIEGNANPISPGSTLKFLCYQSWKKNTIGSSNNFDINKKIPLTITSDIGLESYNATVNFASSDNEFAANVTRSNYTGSEFKNLEGKTDISEWIPANINGIGYKGQDSAYGWWDL